MMQVYMAMLRQQLRSMTDEDLLAFFEGYILPELSQSQKIALCQLMNETVNFQEINRTTFFEFRYE